MKNVVYLSPHFPPNFKYFMVALKARGARVLGIGDEAYERLSTEIKDSVTEYYRVSDMHNMAELEAACNHFINKYGAIDSLDSHNEYWLDTEAKLRETFDIEGLKPADMFSIKNKSGMKEVYRSIGLKVAEGEVVNSFEEAAVFMEKIDHGYPIIAKPDAGVGAAATYKIHNYDELVSTFEALPKIPYILEEFITGQIYSFDGLADENSEPIFFTSHVFSEGIMDVVNYNLDVSYYSLRDIPEELEEAGRRCLKGFNLKKRFFHLEFFKTPTGEFVPLEVNMRPPGGFSVDLFNFACDFNIFDIWANMIVNDVTDLEFSRNFHAAHISRKYNYSYVYSHEDIMQLYGDCIVGYTDVPMVLSKAIGNFCYMVRTEHLDKMHEIVHEIQKKY